MPDDEIRPKKVRLGDETRERIDNLASGWSLDDKPTDLPSDKSDKSDGKPAPVAHPPSGTPAEAIPTSPLPRKKQRTQPPPPPGSDARKQLEQAIVDAPLTAPVPRITLSDVGKRGSKEEILATAPKADASAPVPKPSTNPPRIPPTKPPPIPNAARAKSPSKPNVPDTMFTPERTPPVIIDAALLGDPQLAADLAAGKLPVPVGEFDTAAGTLDDNDKLRVALAQATVVHNPADALLGIPAQPKTVVKETPVEVLLGETAEKLRGDPTSIDPKTSPFERGDPTTVGRDDATEIQAPSETRRPATVGVLRAGSMLRRKRGALGDVRYVFTAVLGVRQARGEVGRLEARQTLRQTSRKRHLVTLGRSAVSADAFDHPALGKARESLQTIEDERSKHAGAVAASDAELERVRRDREVKTKQLAALTAATGQELAELAKKLEPLEKEAAVARRRASDLKDQLRKIAKQVGDTEALLHSVKGEKMDRAGIQAELATLKADEKSVRRDEPAIAAELDALEPRIAAIKAARSEAEKKQTEAEASEKEDQRRTTELFEAIGAKRKVVERAMAEAEAARDKALFELGERLYVDRPQALSAQLSPVDQIDLELGETDRRIMELREILSNVDRPKLLRGALLIFLALAIAGSFIAWLLYMLL